MTWNTPWAVLAPGEPAWLEHHARTALGLEEEDRETKLSFKIVPGHSRYYALEGLDETSVGDDFIIAEQLSRACPEPVYSIFNVSDPPLVFRYHNGVSEFHDVERQELAKSLGCPFQESEEPPIADLPRPLRTVALVEGVLSHEALHALKEEYGQPPRLLRFEDTPKGLIITSETGSLGFAYIDLSERLPHATVYGVKASPSLDIFIVSMIQGGEGLGQFAQPPRETPAMPPVNEIKGERTPERILAALGISAERFQP